MIVVVKYGRLVDLDKARRCPRCEGTGHERYHHDVTCPHCEGAKVRPDGWAYRAGDLALQVGDVVEVPRTPYSGPGPQFATVIGLNADYPTAKSQIIRVIEKAEPVR